MLSYYKVMKVPSSVFFCFMYRLVYRQVEIVMNVIYRINLTSES